MCLPDGASSPPPQSGLVVILRSGVMQIAPGGACTHPPRSEILEQVVALISLARPLVDAIQRKDRDLASQVRRALSSVGLNIAEAFGNTSGNSRLRFETACGSLYEAQAGVRIAISWGYSTHHQAMPTLAALDLLGGRIYGLSRR